MGYAEAPWTFRGRAIYQLQLVRSEEARRYVPPEFKLVELFGWTLGGFYLARYEDSPVGAFDEFVALAGLVWNPPTSCAWAARVYVNNREARDHGLSHVGLPSRLATFTADAPPPTGDRAPSWWRPGSTPAQQQAGSPPSSSCRSTDAPRRPAGAAGDTVVLGSAERGRRSLAHPVATLLLPPLRTGGFLGPRLQLSLPSFSGGTLEHPRLLQYSCQLRTDVMPVASIRLHLAQVQGAGAAAGRAQAGGWWCPWARPPPLSCPAASGAAAGAGGGHHGGEGGEDMAAVLGGKPVLALAFSNMVMTVDEPQSLALPAEMTTTASCVPARACTK